MAQVLFYTPQAQRDYLGHLIVRVTHGTWSHVAVERNGEVIEAVPPAVRKLTGAAANKALNGAGAKYYVQGENEALAWKWLEAQIGHGYSFATLVTDLIANVFGLRGIVKLPGTHVCSSLVAYFLRLSNDKRLPYDLDTNGVTPADLGGYLLGRRMPK